jgi:hypothetical protein
MANKRLKKKKLKQEQLRQSYIQEISRIEHEEQLANYHLSVANKKHKQVKEKDLKTVKQISPIKTRETIQELEQRITYHIPTSKHKSDKTPEQIHEQRLKNLEKARETRKRNLDAKREAIKTATQEADTIPQISIPTATGPDIGKPSLTLSDGYVVDKQTGEIYGQVDATKYPSFSDMVINNFMAELNHFPAMAQPLFQQWLNELLANHSKDDVAEMLEEGKSRGLTPDYTVAYNKEKLLSMIADFMDYLPEASQYFKDELADRLEFGEDWESPD